MLCSLSLTYCYFFIKLLLIFHIWEIREVRYVVIVNDFRQ